MRDVSVTVLRKNLAAYLRRARRGERIRITSRGRVIAEIAPPSIPAPAAKSARELLRRSVLRFDRPLEPVMAPEEWNANR